jgi:hypothetical protein
MFFINALKTFYFFEKRVLKRFISFCTQNHVNTNFLKICRKRERQNAASLADLVCNMFTMGFSLSHTAKL